MHPTWFIDQLRTDWPNEWQNILSKNNEHPPMVIRVNTRQHTRVQYQEILQSSYQKVLKFVYHKYFNHLTKIKIQGCFFHVFFKCITGMQEIAPKTLKKLNLGKYH